MFKGRGMDVAIISDCVNGDVDATPHILNMIDTRTHTRGIDGV